MFAILDFYYSCTPPPGTPLGRVVAGLERDVESGDGFGVHDECTPYFAYHVVVVSVVPEDDEKRALVVDCNRRNGRALSEPDQKRSFALRAPAALTDLHRATAEEPHVGCNHINSHLIPFCQGSRVVARNTIIIPQAV